MVKVFLNDTIIPAKDAKVSIFDHGFLYGDGIFETLREYRGVVFQFDEHLKRLRRSAERIGLDIHRTDDEIKLIVYETLSANGLEDAYIRITISRGEGAIGHDPDLCSSATFLVIAQAFSPYPNAYYENGIKTIIAKTRRNLKESINPEIKSLNFLNNILAKMEAKRAEVEEAIMLNSSGYITECTVSNLFFYKDNILHTPSVECGILDGITRNLVLDIARRDSLWVREGQYAPQDLYEAGEIFLTNTSMEIMPVSSVDDVKFPIGEVTKLLQRTYIQERDAYIRHVKDYSPSIWGGEE